MKSVLTITLTLFLFGTVIEVNGSSCLSEREICEEEAAQIYAEAEAEIWDIYDDCMAAENSNAEYCQLLLETLMTDALNNYDDMVNGCFNEYGACILLGG